jgi:hypothetical protein
VDATGSGHDDHDHGGDDSYSYAGRRRSIDADIDYVLSRLHPRGHSMRMHYEASRGRGPWTGGTSSAQMRVSDTERNKVADQLSHHFADGRLDQSEFKDRLDTAMSSKTRGDLSGLLTDLPPLAADPSAKPAHPGRRRRRHLGSIVLLLTLALLVVDSAVSTVRWHFFAVPWFLVFVFGVFVWHRISRRW